MSFAAAAKKKPPDAVLLSTLHGAKGLEFPVVFLAGVSEGFLPLKTGAAPADEAEERRLLYVGLTRAKEDLLVLYPSSPSSFLSTFPAACFQKETLHKKQSVRQLDLFSS